MSRVAALPAPDAAALEAFLARLYTDDAARSAFLADPRRVAVEAGLGAGTADALAAIDRDGLVLTARSLAARRGSRAQPKAAASWWRRLVQRVTRREAARR